MLGKGAVLHHRAAHVAIHFGTRGQSRRPVTALRHNTGHVPARHGRENIGCNLLKMTFAHDVIDGVDAGRLHAQQHLPFAHLGQVERAHFDFINATKFGVISGLGLLCHELL